MRSAKPTRPNKADYRVTVRLDAETYRRLTEAVEQGAMKNLSEALREMIRQKLWELRFSNEMQRDLKLNEINEKDLRDMMETVFGHAGVLDARAWTKSSAVLKGMFSAMGEVINKVAIELERREEKGEPGETKRVGTGADGS